MGRVRRPYFIAAAIGLLVVALVIGVGAILVLSAKPAESTAEGIVTEVTPSGTLAVGSFQLRTNDGRTMTFVLGELDLSPPGFNGPHLYVHRATLQPIVVSYRVVGNDLVVDRMVDAIVPSPSPQGRRAGAPGQPPVVLVSVARAVDRS